MTSHAPPRTGRTRPPSWWWFLGPAVLTVAAIVVGGGAFVATLAELDTRYGEVVADGEPHPVQVPAGQRVLVMTPTTVNRSSWDCSVTDEGGTDLRPEAPSGSVGFGGEASSWESQVAVDVPSSDLREVTVQVACRAPDGFGETVLVTKAPAGMVVRIGLMVLGPLVLGGAAVVWLVVLVVLQVVRRTEAT